MWYLLLYKNKFLEESQVNRQLSGDNKYSKIYTLKRRKQCIARNCKKYKTLTQTSTKLNISDNRKDEIIMQI